MSESCLAYFSTFVDFWAIYFWDIYPYFVDFYGCIVYFKGKFKINVPKIDISYYCQLPSAAQIGVKYLAVGSAFSVVGPTVWNSHSPDSLRDPSRSFDSCQLDLKSFIFSV